MGGKITNFDSKRWCLIRERESKFNRVIITRRGNKKKKEGLRLMYRNKAYYGLEVGLTKW